MKTTGSDMLASYGRASVIRLARIVRPDRVVWADASVATLDRRPDVERAYLPDPVLEAPHHEGIVRGTVLESGAGRSRLGDAYRYPPFRRACPERIS